MNLAILHPDLERGGVTRVLENHLLGLDAALRHTPADRLRAAVLHGGRDAGWPVDFAGQLQRIELTLHAVPPLEYDTAAHPEPLASAVAAVLADQNFRPDQTVLHVHNHALGKNVSLPGAVQRLAVNGWRVLLQPHDFAEDFRPTNYQALRAALGATLSGTLYPLAAQVHYAAINRRDVALLAAAGVPESNLHYLPNPVREFSTLPDRAESRRLLEQRCGVPRDARFVLYPVRGLRRKNLGEMLLLSILDEGAVYGLALGPLRAAELPYFERWQTFAQRHRLPVRFGTTEPGVLTFSQNLAAADSVITTSVAEGFGMAFLEPWLAGLPLRGRDLPEITSDFTAAGVQFDGLNRQLQVPLDWIGARDFAAAFQSAGTRVRAAYGLSEAADWAGLIAAKTAGGMVDFGDLNEELQQGLLVQALTSTGVRSELQTLNPQAVAPPVGAASVRANAASVRTSFSPTVIGAHLLRTLHHVLDSIPEPSISAIPQADIVLNRLLDLRRFRLIRDR